MENFKRFAQEKMNFKKWLVKNEMAGTGAIVTCKDIENPNFQIWGSLSNLNCKKSGKSNIKRNIAKKSR